jgi:hypothetical protein
MHTLRYCFALLLLLFMAGCKKEEDTIQPVSTYVAPPFDINGHWKMSSFYDVWEPYTNPHLSVGVDTGSLQFWFTDTTYRLLSYRAPYPNDSGRYVLQLADSMLHLQINSNALDQLFFQKHGNNQFTIYFLTGEEYTLNDTGATPVLGDFLPVIHEFTFTRQ